MRRWRMPELAGQRITGSPLSERDCYQIIMKGLADASVGFRGIARLREDMRWLLPVRILDQMVANAKLMIDRGGVKPLIWLAGDPRMRQ